MNTRSDDRHLKEPGHRLPLFKRDLFTGDEPLSAMGQGEIGGKARGLSLLSDSITASPPDDAFSGIRVDIPRLTVITTQFFDHFMSENGLYELSFEEMTDERIAHHFHSADLPADLTGDLYALIQKIHTPLAVRSSSLLEDSLDTPFAGVYATKMIPNHQPDAETRFHKLTEAVKFVYASTFFKNARSYAKAVGCSSTQEKMAVIIQEVVGLTHNTRFYPDISGVVRSFNHYPFAGTDPETGIVHLALGLGKTIVDGGRSWSFTPDQPRTPPPFNSTSDLLKQTQTRFWAVNMGKSPPHDPLKETEYLVRPGLEEAEYDNVLSALASTYDPGSDQIYIGIGRSGPRIINFGPLLQLGDIPLAPLIQSLIHRCRKMTGGHVEIEFAATITRKAEKPFRLSLLQVRRTAAADDTADISGDLADTRHRILASDTVLGSGIRTDIKDIVYVRPDHFTFSRSAEAARELETLNTSLLAAGRPYLLIGFGRWGSSDPWLGIPVEWGQISGAAVIVECDHPERSIDFSQGSHFFHNVSSLHILYFSIRQSDACMIDWEWLKSNPAAYQSDLVTHVHLNSPIRAAASVQQRKGVILK